MSYKPKHKKNEDTKVPIETSQEFVSREEFLQARFSKLKAETKIKEEQAEIERLKKEKLLSELVSIEDTISAFQQLGSHTKARLKRLISELPPRLDGLEATEMIEIVRAAVDGVLVDLSDITKQLQNDLTSDNTQEEDEDYD